MNSDRVSSIQLLQSNDMVICMANGNRALVGKAARFDITEGHGYTLGAFMAIFRAQPALIDPRFVSFQFQSLYYKRYIANELVGSTIHNLAPSVIVRMRFTCPPIPEQRAIAAVLTDMDDEIDALQARRDKTHAIKQGMMAELLTGRTRLV